MIPKDLHKQLFDKWVGRKYSSRDRIKKRQLHIEPLLMLLKGRNVLEIGCNAGILAYEICKHAKTYIGLEPDKDYYSQAVLVKRYLPQAEFCNEGLSDRQYACDAVVICVALYLLSPKEIEYLKTVLANCDIAIIQERSANRPSTKMYNAYKLHEPKRIRKFLMGCGFHAEVYFSLGQKYFEVVGVRT